MAEAGRESVDAAARAMLFRRGDDHELAAEAFVSSHAGAASLSAQAA